MQKLLPEIFFKKKYKTFWKVYFKEIELKRKVLQNSSPNGNFKLVNTPNASHEASKKSSQTQLKLDLPSREDEKRNNEIRKEYDFRLKKFITSSQKFGKGMRVINLKGMFIDRLDLDDPFLINIQQINISFNSFSVIFDSNNNYYLFIRTSSIKYAK